MRLSKLFADSLARTPFRVETLTDAYRTIETRCDVDRFVARYGDVEIEYDRTAKVYRVPAFANLIAQYQQNKLNSLQHFSKD